MQHVEQAVNTAKMIGYPLVLKIASPDITYKSDVGGVVTGINLEAELREEYEKLIKRVGQNCPGARIAGVTVQKMMEKIDYEIILGAKKDEDFGSVILFGMGGMDVEIFSDFSIGLPPLNQTLGPEVDGGNQGVSTASGLSREATGRSKATGADHCQFLESYR